MISRWLSQHLPTSNNYFCNNYTHWLTHTHTRFTNEIKRNKCNVSEHELQNNGSLPTVLCISTTTNTNEPTRMQLKQQHYASQKCGLTKTKSTHYVHKYKQWIKQLGAEKVEHVCQSNPCCLGHVAYEIFQRLFIHFVILLPVLEALLTAG